MLQIKQKNAGSRPEWLVENRYTFGTGVENNYKVSGVGVQAIQAGLEVNGDNVMLFNLGGGDCVTLNGQVVEKRSEVNAGDIFAIGDAEYLIDDPKQKRNQPKATSSSKSWILKAKNTALANKTFELEGSKIIGRANDCDICLNVVHLSRNHARITVHGSELELEDLNSSNGTFVNGRKIETAMVKAGDEITFDTLKFTVIGPHSEFEKTQMRDLDDGDATTLRPAISANDMAKLARPKAEASKARNNANKPESGLEKTKAPESGQTAAQSESSHSGLIMVTIVGAAILAVVAYLIFA